MSLTSFREKYTDQMLALLWGQWTRLGVFAGTAGAKTKAGRPPAVIDPEALLLVSLELGRMEPRLYDEVLSWLTTHGEVINIQRLENLTRLQPDLDRSLLAAPAAWLLKNTQDLRWKRLAGVPQSKEPAAFFLDQHGQALPSRGEKDPAFRQAGWLRGSVRLRDLSSGISRASDSNLWLTLRYLFGLNIRADVIVYLLTHDSAHPSELSREVHYSQPSLFRVCQELERSGTVYCFHQGNRRRYRLEPGRWRAFLGTEPIHWLNWSAAFHFSQRVWRFLYGRQWKGMSAYLQSSELRKSLQEILRATGAGFLPPDFHKVFDAPGEAFLPAATQRLLKSLGQLSS